MSERVRAAHRRISEVDRPEVWITRRSEHELLALAGDLERRVAAGEGLPLAGLLVAVKDNIDVAGLPTTAACPAYAYQPEVSATAVSRLVEAGALVLGKTNLDQFATGLVGTRSPYGPVRHAWSPRRISGGSSSGSVVAVALGIADVALGTDTAGSGRVPAALHGIIGLKPTLGLVPNTGVVPAARSYDCVTVFAGGLTLAQRVLATMTGPDPADPRSRTWPDGVRFAAAAPVRVAVPDDAGLSPLSDGARRAFGACIDALRERGVQPEVIDIAPFLRAATLLYEGALVAERYAAVGDFVAAHPAEVDPTVGGIVLAAAHLPAHRFATDLETLDRCKAETRSILGGLDALLLPTTTDHPAISDVRADPVRVNSRLGTYTNFVNLLDMCAVAVPAGTADDGPFGVSVIGRAFDDQVVIDIAALLTGEQADTAYPTGGVDLVVFGAHLRGQPRSGELTGLGARFVREVRTAPEYRMVALPTDPPKPGIVHDPDAGAALLGERWTISPAALGRFLADLPAPMALGKIRLDDGDEVVGFRCDPTAAGAGEDITAHGGWRTYLDALTRSVGPGDGIASISASCSETAVEGHPGQP